MIFRSRCGSSTDKARVWEFRLFPLVLMIITILNGCGNNAPYSVPDLPLGDMPTDRPPLVVDPKPSNALNSFPSHQGASPWSFTVVEDPSDTYVVNDHDSQYIDTYLFRSQGDMGNIVIDIPIRRYVGPTDSNGYLLNVGELINRGIVGSKAQIVFPAFDVDESTFPVFDYDGDGIDDQLMNEIDEVYFNDLKLDRLHGSDGQWTHTTRSVPISKIKFPSAPGATALNRFRVAIDVANKDVVLSSGAIGAEIWATAIDWVGIKYEASSPVVLVHGIRSSGAAFADFQIGLTSNYVVSDASINLADVAAPDPLPSGCPDIPYNNSIAHNIDQLATLIPAIAQRYGTKSIHLITHSKGGLDSIGLMSRTVSSPIEISVGTMSGQPVIRNLEFRSLVTLDTPHLGSVLAKYGVEARQLSATQLSHAGVNLLAAHGFEGSYYCDLTPERASAFTSAALLPSKLVTACVASDADQNGDRQINSAEAANFPSLGGLGQAYAANTLYNLVGNATNVTVTVTPSGHWYIPDTITVDPTLTSDFLVNDVVVTQQSANRFPRFQISGWNHLNVHSTPNAVTISQIAQSSGLVDWRLR